MRLNVAAFALAIGLIWAVGLLIVGLLNLAYPTYGKAMLDMATSIYPGYHASRAIGDLIIGALYAFADGAVFGGILALLYNVFTPRR